MRKSIFPSRPTLIAVLMASGWFVTACSVDNSGLNPGAVRDGGAGRDASVGGATGSGGQTGTGSGGSGPVGTGGAPDGTGGTPVDGSGGSPGTGGTIGTGGATGTGGADGTGGAVGTGGRMGTGGAMGGTSGGGGRGGHSGAGGAGGARPACGPTTCPDGCCAGDMCVAGRTRERCGRGGGSCKACRSCFRCDSGECELNPQSNWSVSCDSATIAAEKPNGDKWDGNNSPGPGGSAPDPFCQAMQGILGGSEKTSSILDSYMPTWKHVFGTQTAATLMGSLSQIRIAVIDDDTSTTSDDQICSIGVSFTEADFERGSATFSHSSCTNLTIGLTCAVNTGGGTPGAAAPGAVR